MSYIADVIMRASSPDYAAHGYIRTDQEIQDEKDANTRANQPPVQADAPAAPAETAPPQMAAQANTPEGDANIAAERQRYQTAGYDQQSRLLGGPKGTLGG